MNSKVFRPTEEQKKTLNTLSVADFEALNETLGIGFVVEDGKVEGFVYEKTD